VCGVLREAKGTSPRLFSRRVRRLLPVLPRGEKGFLVEKGELSLGSERGKTRRESVAEARKKTQQKVSDGERKRRLNNK